MLKIEIGEPIVIGGALLGCLALLILLFVGYQMLDRYLTHLEPTTETSP